jgi:hypothetical protein
MCKYVIIHKNFNVYIKKIEINKLLLYYLNKLQYEHSKENPKNN